MAPLWLTMPTGPSAGGASMNMVAKLATAPVPKLARPWLFGPTMRIPLARARATMARCAASPASPVSPNPDAMTMQTFTPRSAQASTAWMPASPGIATTTSSGASGTAARSG